jgi:hypothetical protein
LPAYLHCRKTVFVLDKQTATYLCFWITKDMDFLPAFPVKQAKAWRFNCDTVIIVTEKKTMMVQITTRPIFLVSDGNSGFEEKDLKQYAAHLYQNY